MDTNNKDRIIMTLLVLNFAAILFVGWQLTERIDQIERTTSDYLSDIQNELWQMDGRIELSVERILREERNLVKYLGFDVQDVDIDHMTASVDLVVDLKEKNSDTEIYCIYEGESSGGYKMVPMEAKDQLKYSCEIDLSLRDDYEFSIVESKGDSVRTMSAEPSRLSLMSRYYEGRIVGGSGSGSAGMDKFYHQTSIEMNLLSLDSMGPETVEMQIYNGEELVDAVDVTGEVLFGEDRYALEQEMSASMDQHYPEVDGSGGSASVSASSTTHEFTSAARINELPGMTYYMVHGIAGSAKNYDIKDMDRLDVRYRITFMDGYVDEH